jgi:ssDNA-binding replication factor A large subunit
VRVISAYVKQGLDGKPNLNMGKRGRIEVITDSSISSKLASLSELAKQVDAIQDGETILAVDGLAATDSKRSTFVRRDDGSNGSLTQFELKGQGDKTARVVVWDGVDLPEVKSGSKVRVTNLRQKKGRQGEAELHGDSGSVIRILGGDGDQRKGTEVAPVSRLVKVAEVAKHGTTGSIDLEVMALSKGSVREVNIKDGSTARKGEVVLGDDTGEITTVAWDDASRMIAEIQVGEKLRVHGATIQVSKMGVETLELGRSSTVERMRGKG